jgi:hypothetical protein
MFSTLTPWILAEKTIAIMTPDRAEDKAFEFSRKKETTSWWVLTIDGNNFTENNPARS